MQHKHQVLSALAGFFAITGCRNVLAQRTYYFSNSGLITIPSSGASSPYPSSIAVAGVVETVTKVIVELWGLTHTRPDDINVLLVGPTGTNVMLMSDVGGRDAINGITLIFDDKSPGSLPDSTLIFGGTYKPTNFEFGDVLPSPAPPRPYGQFLSAFNGQNANGIWSLYVFDDGTGDSGIISRGWSITIVTLPYIFSNPNSIIIPSNGGASYPYPSSLTVAGVFGTVTQVIVTLSGLTLILPGNIDVLLVGPTGTNVMLMSGAGGYSAIYGISFTFDDFGVSLPRSGKTIGGTYKPTNFEDEIVHALPSPAPPRPYGQFLSTFNGQNVNGIWSLYVNDSFFQGGYISKGWSLTVTTTQPKPPTTSPTAAPTTIAPTGAPTTIAPTGAPTRAGLSYGFSNSGLITIPSSGASSPYPSSLTVAGVVGTVTDVIVTLSGLTHTYPSDLDVLLVGPTGTNVMLMSDVGGRDAINAITLTFDDISAVSLSDTAQIFGGTYKPTNFELTFLADAFPRPAPPGPYGKFLSAFNGQNANGIWSLFVFDGGTGDSGIISNGWSLTIVTPMEPTTMIGAPTESPKPAPTEFPSFGDLMNAPTEFPTPAANEKPTSTTKRPTTKRKTAQKRTTKKPTTKMMRRPPGWEKGIEKI